MGLIAIPTRAMRKVHNPQSSKDTLCTLRNRLQMPVVQSKTIPELSHHELPKAKPD